MLPPVDVDWKVTKKGGLVRTDVNIFIIISLAETVNNDVLMCKNGGGGGGHPVHTTPTRSLRSLALSPPPLDKSWLRHIGKFTTDKIQYRQTDNRLSTCNS